MSRSLKVAHCAHAPHLQCPRGTPVPIACPPGTYSDATDLASVDGCSTCPVGHACGLGTSRPELCVAGQYGATPGQKVRACTGGCAEGHYCPEGSTNSTSVPCRERHAGNRPWTAAHLSHRQSELLVALLQPWADSTPTSEERVFSIASSARPTRSSQFQPHRRARTARQATSSRRQGRVCASHAPVVRGSMKPKAGVSSVRPIHRVLKERRAAMCASTIATVATPPLPRRPPAASGVQKGRAAVGIRLGRR